MPAAGRGRWPPLNACVADAGHAEVRARCTPRREEYANPSARIIQRRHDATALGGDELRYLKVSVDLVDSRPRGSLAEVAGAAAISFGPSQSRCEGDASV